ncbi:hypothetical protein MCG98_15895 [Ruminococcus sp. OA3]|uniref:hypothetical protein n=1 Tax=Ruminococcus sp. OA3 TaxID=2914164 RepID=UPI001F06A15A|nr:hypothetical protein [Ruminococcus sp. OA3]MCH1984053.1 hypothetical protein [Ruminococcus sp. OA3]
MSKKSKVFSKKMQFGRVNTAAGIRNSYVFIIDKKNPRVNVTKVSCEQEIKAFKQVNVFYF